MKRATYVLLACVFVMCGCVTDKLAIFEGNALTDDEMTPFIGKYKAVAATDDDGKSIPQEEIKTTSLEVTKKDNAYHFRYSQQDTSFGSFVLSRIPDSKAGLLLFASPAVKDMRGNTIENVFFIAKREKELIHVWLMLGSEPVTKEFPFTREASQGGFKVAELKEFLKKHADKFVEKNAARITFKKTS